MTPDPEAAKRLAEALMSGKPVDLTKVRALTRVTLKKFDGDDLTKEPVETIVREDEGFREAAGLGDKDATD